MSIGGIFGACSSALLANYNPAICFAGTGIVGMILFILTLSLDSEIENCKENDDEVEGPRSFCIDVKRNMTEVREAFKIKEFYGVVLYLVLKGITVPRFGSFSYYIRTDVYGIPKATLAMMRIVSYVCMYIGSQAYGKFLKGKELITLVTYGSLLTWALAPIEFI